MSVIHPTSDSANRSHRYLSVRLARGICFVLFANPIPLVVVTLCGWLLWGLLVGLRHRWAEGAVGGAPDVLGCMGCFVALVLLSTIAAGHVLLTFFAGCRDDKR